MTINSIKDFLFRGGLTEEQYDRIKQRMVDETYASLLIYAPIGSIVFCLLLILSTLTTGAAASNQWIYANACAAMCAIALCAHFIARERPAMVSVLKSLFIVALYAFAISVSSAHAEYPAVSPVVLIVVAPMLFVDRPIKTIAGVVAAAAITCMASFYLKSPEIAIDDAWNVVSFGSVAVVANAFVMRLRIASIYQSYKIAYLSEVDLLTGLKNRNYFENRLEDYPRAGEGVLVCAYADANGLHELNNSQGHDAGDAFLCAIAHEMQSLFGEEHTYRIGGDEFVGFWPQGSLDVTRAKLTSMQERLAAEGYSVSCGAASVDDVIHADMRSLVRDAEREMFAQKFGGGYER